MAGSRKVTSRPEWVPLSGDSGEVLFDEAPMDADNSYGIALNDVSGAVYSSSSCALKMVIRNLSTVFPLSMLAQVEGFPLTMSHWT